MSGVDRRTTIKWTAGVAALMAAGWGVSRLPSGAPKIAATGYGKDPPLVEPVRNPWPLTLNEETRTKLAEIVDIIVPGIDGAPTGSAVGLVEFFNEWLSAPYPDQQADRALLMPMFTQLRSDTRPRIAGLSKNADPAFRRFCTLAAAAYHTTPQGIVALGFVGNEPRDSFDGPPDEVIAHLRREFKKLGSA